MRKAALLVVALFAVSALGDVSTGYSCYEREPETQWDYPSCADYHLDTSLIEAAEKGDRSAIELLQRRYRSMLSWEERARIGGALLGRIANDEAIWKELAPHAEDYVRFGAQDEETQAKLEAYCAEHGYDRDEYLSMAYHCFAAVAADRRSRPLLLRALAAEDRDVAGSAIYGFGLQHDESALPLIEEALQRFDSPEKLAELLCFYHSEAADQLALRYMASESDREWYRDMQRSSRNVSGS